MSNTSTLYKAQALLPKLSDADADLRYMSLNDLYNLLNTGSPTFLHTDYHSCAKIVDGVIQTLDDTNGEVQNQAIKCVSALVLKLPPDILAPFVHRISTIKTTHSVDSSIPATALRTFITAFPPPVPRVTPSKKTQEAYSAISKVLIPRLLGYVVLSQNAENHSAIPPGMLELGHAKGANSDAVDVMVELVRCFGPMLDEREKLAISRAILDILDDTGSSSIIKKKAVTASSLLAVHLPDRLLSAVIGSVTERLRDSGSSLPKRRLYLNVIGAFSKSIPHRLDPYLKILAPLVLSALGVAEFEAYERDAADDGSPNVQVDEVREAALVSLEGFLSSCVKPMAPFTNDSIDSAIRFVGYDPMSAASEDDEEMGDINGDGGDDADGDEDEDNFDEEEDFEEDGTLSDDDDSSWKIRRCAVKTLYAIISTRSNGDLLENGILYDKIAPVLVKRFKEREENVRLEILRTLSSLVRKTGEGAVVLAPSAISEVQMPSDATQRSRKRRRVDSIADPFDASGTLASTIGLMSPATSPSPVSGSRADLARLSPAIVRGLAKLLKQPSPATKQAAITLLRDLVVVQSGGLSDLLDKIADPLVEAIRASAPSSTTASSANSAGVMGSRMRIEALELVSAICDTHPSKTLSPHIDSIVPAVVSAVGDKYYKVSSQALLAVESNVKALTPPRSAGSDQQRKTFLNIIYDAIVPVASAPDTDLEVRQRAIHALGVLLSRTAGSASTSLGAEKRAKGLSILQDRLKNETTRIAAVKAVDLTTSTISDSRELQPAWLIQVALELAAQLRKADRVLRNTSLAAIRNLVTNDHTLKSLDDETVYSLAEMLLPVLASGDLNAVAMALTCLNILTGRSPQRIADKPLNDALCQILTSPLAGTMSEPVLRLIQTIGEKGVGQILMEGLCRDVGVSGDPAIVGRAIGTLLISGGQTIGISLDDFVTELKTSGDPRRTCLALSVLGEAGFRLASDSPLEPQLFYSHFTSESEGVPRVAAFALGRAGAGNVSSFLPFILNNARQDSQLQYLYLHSIKEILHFGGRTRTVVTPYTKQIWETLLEASQADDSKIVGAECLGRIAVTDPLQFLPILQNYLKDVNPRVRGLAIQALRFTVTDNDEYYEEVLKPNLVKMLGIMLSDPNLDNRRLALSTLNSAMNHKPDVILPALGTLVPLVIKESRPDPDLIREVKMGPFVHKVDDGLELRMSAYETLLSFIESAYSRLNHVDVFDRIIAGLEDEHEIKMLCCLATTKLSALDPEEMVRRLDSIAEKFRLVLSVKPKENAVKQEVERVAEANKAALLVSVQLAHAYPQALSAANTGAQGQGWKVYWEWVSKDFKSQVSAAEQEVRNQA